jgi:hypothetical protein
MHPNFSSTCQETSQPRLGRCIFQDDHCICDLFTMPKTAGEIIDEFHHSHYSIEPQGRSGFDDDHIHVSTQAIYFRQISDAAELHSSDAAPSKTLRSDCESRDRDPCCNGDGQGEQAGASGRSYGLSLSTLAVGRRSTL